MQTVHRISKDPPMELIENGNKLIIRVHNSYIPKIYPSLNVYILVKVEKGTWYWNASDKYCEFEDAEHIDLSKKLVLHVDNVVGDYGMLRWDVQASIESYLGYSLVKHKKLLEDSPPRCTCTSLLYGCQCGMGRLEIEASKKSSNKNY